MHHRLLVLQKIDWCLNPKFQAETFPNASTQEKVRKKDFCLFLARKQQKRCDRAPLTF